MKSQTILLLFTLLLAFQSATADDCLKRLATANFPEYVSCLQYPVQTHTVVTDDGYKLTVFRIQGKRTSIVPNKPVVLFWHGLLDSADGWVINDEQLAPAFVFANRGYDVWLGNTRGNKYSLAHVRLDPKSDKEFWDFSFQHASEHDLPAAFAYIGKATGKKINYIAHSQGTTQMFAHLANPSGKHPAVAANLRKFAALGPVAYMKNLKSTLLNTIARVPLIHKLLWVIGRHGLLLPNWLATEGGRILCKTVPGICGAGMWLVSDEHPELNNKARYDILGGHFPAGTSVLNIFHWRQGINSGGAFTKYDYGSSDNKKMYGQSNPPVYNPALIREDVAMFVGTSDELADTKDATNWFNGMVNAKRQIKYYPIGHMTFLIGKQVPYMNDLIAFIESN